MVRKHESRSLTGGPGRHFDVAGTGFTVLDRVYSDGSLTDETLGGSCGNVLISLAMLRRNVAPVLALGDDEAGGRLIKEFYHAGATTRFISRRRGVRSPILAQQLDTISAQHEFSFVCPETHNKLPRYRSIDESELRSALPVLTRCSVFYVDRISESIVEAMIEAKSSGAIVFFEPSKIGRRDLFDRAVAIADILKYATDRFDTHIAPLQFEGVKVVTYGADGLEITDSLSNIWCPAIPTANVLDTCGAGDMVSVGIINRILSDNAQTTPLRAHDLKEGAVAGQRLASANCFYVGARGLFKARGAAYAKCILDGLEEIA